MSLMLSLCQGKSTYILKMLETFKTLEKNIHGDYYLSYRERIVSFTASFSGETLVNGKDTRISALEALINV